MIAILRASQAMFAAVLLAAVWMAAFGPHVPPLLAHLIESPAAPPAGDQAASGGAKPGGAAAGAASAATANQAAAARPAASLAALPAPSPAGSPAALPGSPATAMPPAIPMPTATRVSIPPIAFPPVDDPPPKASASMPSIVHSGETGSAVAIPHPAIQAPRVPIVPVPRMPSAPLPALYLLPLGQGPFPAIVLPHPCDGPSPGLPPWAFRLYLWGYAVVSPDSFSPRGATTVCDPAEQASVTPWDRAGDLGAAVAWLRTRPEIDPARIGVLGQGHGGTVAAIATIRAYARLGLVAAVDYYGTCPDPALAGAVPLLVLAGDADLWADPAKRCPAYGAALNGGRDFEVHAYPGATHAFDVEGLPKTVSGGRAMGYDKAAADDSFRRVKAFLDRYVKR